VSGSNCDEWLSPCSTEQGRGEKKKMREAGKWKKAKEKL